MATKGVCRAAHDGGIYIAPRTVENRLVAEHPRPDNLADLYLLCREYEATLQVTSDPEEQWRLRRILQELRTCILNMQNR